MAALSGAGVLSALQQTLAADANARTLAEQQLAAAEASPGFGPLLLQIALSAEQVPEPLRQSAALLLKNYIRSHWQEGERGFKQPEVSAADRHALRQGLPAGLAVASASVRTAVAMAIAAVAAWDWPQAWPGLVEGLVGAVTSRQEPHLVHGALRCLAMMSTDLDEEQKPALCHALAPALAAIVADPDPAARKLAAPALQIMAELVAGLGALSGAHQRQTRDLMAPLLPQWCELVGGVLAQPVSSQAPLVLAQQLQALRLLLQFVSFFSKAMQPHMPAMLARCWQLMTAALLVYERELVHGEDPVAGPSTEAFNDGLVPGVGEGDEQPDLSTMVSQLFEVLLAVVGHPRLQGLVRPALGELVYQALGYMQMMEEQADAWADDPNQYIADEDEDMVSPRVSAELLLQELHDAYECAAVQPLLAAAERRMQEAAQARAAGRAGGWQLREAVLQALGSYADNFEECLEQLPGLQQQLTALLGGVLSQDLSQEAVAAAARRDVDGSGQQFLVGRALWAAGKLGPLTDDATRAACLQAAAAGVASQLPAPVKIGACRSLAALAQQAPQQQLVPLVPGLVAALAALLASSTEETLHLVLETLSVLLRTAPEAAAPQAIALTPALLQVWAQNTTDPLVSEDALEVLESLAACPACLPALAQHATPTLAGIVSHPQGQPPMLVEASLDLLAALVKAAAKAGQRDVMRALAGAALPPALQLLSSPAGEDAAQQATQLVIELVRAGGRDLLTWLPGRSSEQALHAIAEAVQRLLSPQLGDAPSALAGPLAVQLIRSLPDQMRPTLPSLVEAAAAKLAASSAPPVVGGLILLMSRLALLDAAALLGLLEHAQLAGADGQRQPALAAVLPLWLERISDVAAEHPTKQAVAALLRLLDQRQRPSLAGLSVKGEPIATSGGVRTRAQARQAGGPQHHQVPAPVKMLGCVMDAYVSAREAEGRTIRGTRALWGYESDSEDGESGSLAAPSLRDSRDSGMGLSLTGRSLTPTPRGDGPGLGLMSADLLDMVEESMAGAPLGGEDPAERADPLYRTSLEELITQGVEAIAAADPMFIGSCMEEGAGLSLAQREALRAVLKQPPETRRA